MTTADAFGTPTAVSELDSVDGEYPTWLSPDECRLYFTRLNGDQSDIFVASRTP
jgi:hypothetical protein